MTSKPKTDTVAEYFEIMLKRDFEAGNKSTLLYAIYACLEMKRPIPEWLRAAFVNAYEAAERFQIRSWDEVFDRAAPKGLHLEAERKDEKLRWKIIARVRELKAVRAIDNLLFEDIGRELDPPLKASRVQDLYYDRRGKEIRAVFDSLDAPDNS
jgi:hypothetical protein